MIGEGIGMCSLPVELLFRQLSPASSISVGFAIYLTLLTLVQGWIAHFDMSPRVKIRASVGYLILLNSNSTPTFS